MFFRLRCNIYSNDHCSTSGHDCKQMIHESRFKNFLFGLALW